MQLRLVLLHGEQVVPSAVLDVLADLPLAEDRVTCDDRAIEWQTFEKCQRRGDFVLLWRDDEVAYDGGQSSRERRHDMQRLGVMTA